jgi:hypothetical protein
LRELGGPEALVAASRLHVIRRKLTNLGWRAAIKNLDFANPFFALKN